MIARAGQVWEYGNARSGYTVMVLRTVGETHHVALILDVRGGWSWQMDVGAVEELFEFTNWDEDASWGRLA